MHATHEPRSEFVERLQARIVEEARRHNDAAGRRRWPASVVASALWRKPERRWVSIAAVAVLALTAAIGAAIFRRPADDELFRVVEGDVRVGETIRANGGTGAVLALSDGSRVEMRSNSELAVDRATDGIRIRLHSGGIIVNAAEQRAGHLYVQTSDVTVSVVGTVFLVNADAQGSRVAVIEGEVRVQQGGAEETLRPGDQVATNPQVPPPPVVEEIAWSRYREAHSQKLEQSIALFLQELEIKLDLSGVQQGGSVARAANTPKWEVTSVRQCRAEGEPGARGGGTPGTVAAGGVRIDPSFLRVVCMRLRYLIEDAYVKYLEPDAFRQRWIFPVTGGPDWLDTDLYSIDARPVNPPVDRQMMGGPMLQALLEERFKLKLRREAQQEPVYELRVADSGFKLQPLKEGECEARKRRISEEQIRNPPPVAAPGEPLTILFPGFADADGRTVRACGFTAIGQNDPSPGARTLRLHGSRVYDLTNYLSLDRIILDKTGIQGLFDIVVTYGADVSPMGNRVRPGSTPIDVTPTQTPRVPSGADPVFDALRKQLGLELVPTIGPRTYYFVEHVERPTPN
jgi:uncharacterized protein (TIGR03435 family)